MKKKTEYSTSIVMMVILVLALPIALPPLFRTFFAEEEIIIPTEKRVLLTCNKDAVATEGYRVTSSTLYTNDLPDKNTINFFIEKQEQRVEDYTVGDPVIYNRAVEEPNILMNEETSNATRTVTEELEFFRGIPDISFNESENVITVEVTNQLIVNNSGNLELSNYLSDAVSQEDFYVALGYSCFKEDI